MEPGEAVLEQWFKFRPWWWLSKLAEATWGAFLTDLPTVEGGYHRIARRDLLTAVEHDRPDTLPGGLVASYVWGTGSSGFLVGRRARVFATDPRRVSEALAAAVQTLQQDGPARAYESMLRGRSNHLRFLGPSFFTKFLYAADATGTNPGRALILDQFVAVALNDVHGWDIRATGPWPPSTYERWLDHAHGLAERATERTGEHVRPDEVEKAYFTHGQELVRSSRSSGTR